MEKKDIRRCSQSELEAFFTERGWPAFRGRQTHEWLWKKGAASFEDMTNLPKPFRAVLGEYFAIHRAEIADTRRSSDGTIKNAVRLHDGAIVESVLIPTASRTTACVSSQAGCSLDCRFCATAALKRMRNLSAAEIVDQVRTIDRQSREHYGMPLKNIVFMGMGEPLMNYTAVMEAVDRITSAQGLAFSPKRITISTSGIPKMIKTLADEKPKFKLAVSLHSAIEGTRNRIMPFTKSFPLAELQEALKYWYDKARSRITYEYIVWKGINDTPRDVEALLKFCRQAPCKVNLIQYNAIGSQEFTEASSEAIGLYMSQLAAHGMVVKIRRSRGADIDAACGQLANKNLNTTLPSL